MGAQKEKMLAVMQGSPPWQPSRQSVYKESLISSGAKNRAESTGDIGSLHKALLQIEGSYTATKKSFSKNEYMKMLIEMAQSQDSKERERAALAFGQLRVDFPEFSDRNMPQGRWIDEMLLLLGTDRDIAVSRAATVALNMKGSIAAHTMEQLKKLQG